MKKMKHKKQLLLVWMVLSLFCVACGTYEDSSKVGKVEADPLSEAEIIEYVKDYVYQAYKDEVEVEIVSKTPYGRYELSSFSMDLATFYSKYVNIKDAYRYGLVVINPEYGLTVEGGYVDAFTIKNKHGGGIYHDSKRDMWIDDNYKIMRKEAKYMERFGAALSEYTSKYHVYKSPTNTDYSAGYYNIYVCCPDEEQTNNVHGVLTGYTDYYSKDLVSGFNVMIFRDEQLYDSIDFDRFNNIPFVEKYGGGQSEGTLTREDIEQHPEKMIERYLGSGLAYIGNKAPSFYTAENANKEFIPFDHMIHVYTAYSNPNADDPDHEGEPSLLSSWNTYGINQEDIPDRVSTSD